MAIFYRRNKSWGTIDRITALSEDDLEKNPAGQLTLVQRLNVTRAGRERPIFFLLAPTKETIYRKTCGIRNSCYRRNRGVSADKVFERNILTFPICLDKYEELIWKPSR